MAPPLKIGLNIVWAKPELLMEYAQLAEALGYESVWSGEHVALSTDPDLWRSYPRVVAAGEGASKDLMQFDPDSIFLDPLAVLAHLAAGTKTLRLGVGIYLLGLRHPVLVGRTLATLDVLSKGRIDLAVGLGWTPDEYTATGNVWQTRGRRMDEMIRALHVLFEEPTPEFHGEFFDFGPIAFEPKPVQRPFPIHIGGGSAGAERRAAALGVGWYGGPDHIPAIRGRLAEAGRDQSAFQFSNITLQGPVPLDDLHALAEQGVQRVVVTPWPKTRVGEVGREGLAAVEQYAKDIGLV